MQGDPEASASNDVVMQDAEVAPDTEVHGEAPAAGYEALEEDLNSLAALVARRPGVLEDGDTLLSAIDFADLPGEDEGFTPLTDTELVELVLSDNAPGLVDVLDTDADCTHL
jgi:hypothetical protein